jgi:chemotaxis protein histidine kinase CheA
VVIARAEAQRIGIVVDQVIGQQQVVIKALGERFRRVKGISGAAILADGHVGLILEPTGLLRLYDSGDASLAPEGAWSEARAGLEELGSSAEDRRVADARREFETADADDFLAAAAVWGGRST